jgi:ABC-type transport system involved in multi-copper enzyme maturation permease subunit
LVVESKVDDQQIPKEKLEESRFYRELSVKEPTWRERTASSIAYSILALFALSLLISFAYAFYVLVRSNSLDEKTVDASLAGLKAVAGVFTPLLAFILGYYFTKKEE